MSNILARMKTYNFWISLVSAIILLLRIIGDKFNFFVDAALIMDITTGLCGIFVVLGIISAPSGKKEETKVDKETVEPIGRFNAIAQANAEEKAEVIEIEERIVEDDVIAESSVNETEEIVETEEIEEVVVENTAEIEENIQEEIQTCETVEVAAEAQCEEEKSTARSSDKEEIAEILTILLEKINSL